MRIRDSFRFLFQFVTVGLAGAFVLVFLKPELLQTDRPVVQITEQAQPATAVSRQAQGEPLTFSAAVTKAAPAVVNIYSAKVVERGLAPSDDPLFRRFFGDAFPSEPRIETALGSGVIFSSQGYVVTNNHVISGADEIQVMLNDGRSSAATVVGSDPETDLAVLRIKMPEDLPTITLGDSDGLKVGDLVLAIGNPYGVGQAVTMGIVSATGRKRLGLNTFENFIQTDAAINPGNSGGALVNTNGDLIGVNTAIFSKTGGSQGIGFAIPSNLAKGIMTEIIENGRVTRGWLGISMANLPPDRAREAGLANALGVVVATIVKGSPAEQAGLHAGDILVRVDRKNINDARQMLDVVARQKPGSRIVIDGIREGKAFTVEAVVAQRPDLQ